MIPAEFDYAAPTSLDEATALLASTPGAKVLGGGMSLIPALKHRLAQTALLVDLARVPDLDVVREKRGRVTIGGCTPHARFEANEALVEMPIFSDAARVLGDPQVRNRGTFGGSLVHADPAADWPAVFLALDGEATVTGPKGPRKIAARDFFVGMLTSAVGVDEVLTEVTLQVERKRAGAAYAKLRQPASGFAIVGAAAQLVLDRKGRCDRVSLGMTGVNGVPFRAESVEARLRGEELSTAVIREACATVEEADALEDPYASAEYRSHLAGVFAARAIERAFERAR